MLYVFRNKTPLYPLTFPLLWYHIPFKCSFSISHGHFLLIAKIKYLQYSRRSNKDITSLLPWNNTFLIVLLQQQCLCHHSSTIPSIQYSSLSWYISNLLSFHHIPTTIMKVRIHIIAISMH